MANPTGKNTPFTKGNEYWKIAVENGTIGRNKEYTALELAGKINEWIEITQNSFWEKEDFVKSGPNAKEKVYLKTATPFLVQDLCLYLRVNRNYFTDLAESIKDKNDAESKEFSRIIAHVDQLITNQKLQGGIVGAYNPMLVSRLEGLKEKTDITSNDKDIQGIASITITREDYKALSNDIDNI